MMFPLKKIKSKNKKIMRFPKVTKLRCIYVQSNTTKLKKKKKCETFFDVTKYIKIFIKYSKIFIKVL